MARTEEGKRSSAGAHLDGKDDGLVTVKPVLDRVADFVAFIAAQGSDLPFAAIRAAEQTG